MRRLLPLLLAGLLLAGCSGGDDPEPQAAPDPSSSARPSLTPVPVPPQPPPSGKLLADVQQSSRDSAAGQFQVWVDNDTDRTIRPLRVTYDDGRFRAPLPGTRLRPIPSQARRGYPFAIPGRPACGSEATSGTVTVVYRQDGERRTATVPVEDEADVVEQVTSARCLELTIASVADLSLADEVTSDGTEGSVGTMTLRIRPTGRAGPTLRIDSIVGNPVLSPGELGVFQADLTVRGDQQARDVPVPLEPTRCDLHAFGESGSFGEFMVNVHVDGEPGQFLLRLSEAGAASALAFAEASCGFLTTSTTG